MGGGGGGVHAEMNIIVTSRARSNSPPNVQFGDDACHGKSAFNLLRWHTRRHVHAKKSTHRCAQRRRERLGEASAEKQT